MAARQGQDGTAEYVSAIVAGLVGKPPVVRFGWPHIPDLKTAIGLLPGNVKVPSNPKRAVLIQLIALTWRNLPEANRPQIKLLPTPNKPTTLSTLASTTPMGCLPPAPAPPPRRAELDLLEGADTEAAEDVEDEEDTLLLEEEEWEREAAAAESLVETTLNFLTVECRRCFARFLENETHYNNVLNHNVCNDEGACALRVPAGRGGRKRPMQHGAYVHLDRSGRGPN
jgi:hypothetical protein